jgi:hypothetical protein
MLAGKNALRERIPLRMKGRLEFRTLLTIHPILLEFLAALLLFALPFLGGF